MPSGHHPGDVPDYLYDFGDNWEHVIKLEAVAPWDDAAPDWPGPPATAPAAVCLDADATTRPKIAAA